MKSWGKSKLGGEKKGTQEFQSKDIMFKMFMKDLRIQAGNCT